MRCGGSDPAAGIDIYFIIYIDAQDAQDKRDESLLLEEPARQ